MQESLLVNGTVLESIEANIPEVILDVVLIKEVFNEVVCELFHDQIESLITLAIDLAPVIKFSEATMVQGKEAIVLIKKFMEHLGILLLEERFLELSISNSLS